MRAAILVFGVLVACLTGQTPDTVSRNAALSRTATLTEATASAGVGLVVGTLHTYDWQGAVWSDA